MKPFYYLLVIFLVLFSSVCSAQWVKNTNTPGVARDAACEFSIGTKVYYGGGYTNSNVFSEYDPITNTWTKKSNLPLAPNPSHRLSDRAFGLSFSIGSKGYVFGGQSLTDQADANGFDTEQASVTNDLWEYDPSTDTWTAKKALPAAGRDGAMAFVVNGRAYVGAGVNGAGYYLGDFWQYDPTTDTWTQKADLPSGAIGFPMGFSVDNMGYMVGGGISAPPYENTNAYSYDPSTDTWTPVSSFPGTARQAGVGFSIDGLGYVGLGQSQYSSSYSDFYSYNPATDTWTKAATGFPDKNGLGWANAAVAEHTVFIGSGAELPSFNYSSAWYSYVPPNDVPHQVSLVAPADMSMISTTTTMFQWENISDTLTYRLEISASPSFSSLLVDSVIKGISTLTLLTAVPGQYYWRVAARAGIETGPWSASRSFTVAQAGISASVPIQHVQLYPNPTRDFVSFALPVSSHSVTVTIYNALGEKVKSEQIHGNQCDLTSLTSGVYTLEIAVGVYHARERIVKE